MTSELRTAHGLEPASLHSNGPTCLCCCHFAVDLESVPDAARRRTRVVKRKHLVHASSA